MFNEHVYSCHVQKMPQYSFCHRCCCCCHFCGPCCCRVCHCCCPLLLLLLLLLPHSQCRQRVTIHAGRVVKRQIDDGREARFKRVVDKARMQWRLGSTVAAVDRSLLILRESDATYTGNLSANRLRCSVRDITISNLTTVFWEGHHNHDNIISFSKYLLLFQVTSSLYRYL